MATVIDTLIVKLGLDASEFKAGLRDVVDPWKKTGQGAQAVGREVEFTTKRSGEFVNQLTNRVLLLMAAFAGGKSAKTWAQDLVSANAAMGRMAVLAGTTTVELSKWAGAASAMGGSATGAAGSIQSFNNSLVQLQLTGESGVIPYLRALQAFAPAVNLSLLGANGQMRTAVEMLPDLNAAVQGMDKARASVILSGLGLSQDLVNVLVQSRETFNRFMQDQQRWGVVTKEQAAAAQDLQYKTAGVRQSFDTLGRMLIQMFGPAVGKVMDRLTELFVWFQNNPEKLKQAFLGIAATVTALAVAFGGPIAQIGALAAAVYLLYEDWKVWNEGGKAQFGEFWQYVTDKWRDIRDVAVRTWDDVKGTVLPIFDALVTTFKDALEVWLNVNRLMYSLFFGTSEDIKAAWTSLLDSISKQWSNLWNGLAKSIYDAGPAIYDALVKAFGGAFDWVMDRANTIWRAISGKDLFEKKESVMSGGAGGDDPNAPGAKANIPVPANRKEYEEDIADYMRMGWTREQAVGIVANTIAESQGDIKAVGDGGKAYGLHQWHPDRQANFKRVFGKDIRDSTRAEQRAFTNWELNNTEKKAGDALRKAQTPGAAATIFSTWYERPKYIGWEAAKRSTLAEDFYKSLQGPTAASPTAGTRAPVPQLSGAPLAAVTGPLARFGQPQQNVSTSTSEVHIGNLTVNTQATDAQAMVNDIKPAIERNSFAANANYGPI